jgi:hypothetical protein
MMPRGRGRGSPLAPRTPGNAGVAAVGASPAARATPHSARFASAAAELPPSATPPLPKDGLTALIARLSAVHVACDPLLLAKKDVAKFKAEDVRERFNAHLESHKLKKEMEEVDGIRQITVVSRPAHDHTVYFARLDDAGIRRITETGKMELYSVATAPMAAQMKARGYVRVFCNDLGDDTHLPPKLVPDAVSSSAGPSAPQSMAPPGVHIPETGLPSAENKPGERAAAQVMREWELHVEVDGSFFSPCYMWPKDEAKKFKSFPVKYKDNFNQRAKVYCYLKESCGGQVSSMDMGLGELKKMGEAWAGQDDGAAEEGVERSGKRKKGVSWSDRACALAKAAASAPPEPMEEDKYSRERLSNVE